MGTTGINAIREPWNKGRLVEQKAPFKLNDTWALCVRLQMQHRVSTQLLLIGSSPSSRKRVNALQRLTVWWMTRAVAEPSGILPLLLDPLVQRVAYRS
jgi:hypothetical protein